MYKWNEYDAPMIDICIINHKVAVMCNLYYITMLLSVDGLELE